MEQSDSEIDYENTVEVHEATDEEINLFLDSPDEELTDEIIETEEEPESEVSDEAPQGNGSDLETRLKALEEENHKLKSQNKAQEQFIGKRSNEIGELRAKLRAASEQIESQLSESEETLSPREVIKLQGQLDRISEKEQELAGEQAVLKSKETVARFVQPWETMDEDIAQALLSDGIPKEQVKSFIQDPYAYASGTELVHLAKRAQVTRLAVNLYKENQELRSQLDSKQSKGTTGSKVIKNLQTATEPKVNASTVGRGNVNTPVSRKDLTKLSDAELEKILR